MEKAITVSTEELSDFMNNDWLIKALKEMRRTELITETEFEKLVVKRQNQELRKSFIGKIHNTSIEH